MSIPVSEMLKLVEAYKANNLQALDNILVTYLADKHQHRPVKDKEKLCFVIACGKGLDDIVKKYISLRSYDLNTLYNGVDYAISVGDLEIVKFLFEKFNLNPNKLLTKDENLFFAGSAPEGWYPVPFLAHAAGLGHKEIVKYLLSRSGIEINKTFNTDSQVNVTALLGAMSYPEISQILLEHGADPYIPMELVKVTSIPNDVRGWTLEDANKRLVGKTTVFQMAISDELEDGDHELSKVFRAWEAKQNLLTQIRGQRSMDSSPTHSSGSNSPMSLTPNGSPPHSSAMVQHSRSDSPEGLRKGSPPGSPMHTSDTASSGSAGSSPEKVAAIKLTPQQKAAELLRANNNDPDEALLKAMSKEEKENDLEVQKILVDSGIIFKLTKSGSNILYAAAARNRFELFKYMLLKFPNLNIDLGTKNKQTPFHGACSNGSSLELVRFLIDKGADVNAKDINGLTALHFLGHNGINLIEELVKSGASPLLINMKGQTPLQCNEEIYAKRLDDERIIKFLALLKKVTEEAQRKQQVKAQSIQPAVRPSIVSTPSEIQYRSSACRPAVDDKLRPSYGTSSSVMFQQPNSTSNNTAITAPIVVPPPAQRTEPKQVGAPLFVPTPESAAKLPKSDKKSDKKDNSVKKSSVVDKLKSALHL